MRGLLPSTLTTLALALAVQATFYDDPAAIAKKSYDFIVIGVRPVLLFRLTIHLIPSARAEREEQLWQAACPKCRRSKFC